MTFSLLRSSLLPSTSLITSTFQKRYAGTSSAWSMGRLWNSMKKGLGASNQQAMVPKQPNIVQPMTKNVELKAESSTETKKKDTSFIWEPKTKTFTAAEIRRFEVETPMFRCSQQKLNDLGRQLSGLPLDAATLQAKFSPKRPAKILFQVLSQAQANAIHRGQSPSDYIIREAVTGRGKYMKRLDIKGRGRCGIIMKPHAFMRFVLEIPDQRKEVAKLLRVKSIAREDKPSYIKLDY